MRGPTILLAATLLLAGCTSAPPDEAELPPADGASADEITVLATDLDTVWEVRPAPDGGFFLTERPGRVRVVSPSEGLLAEPWATPSVAEQGESGLMGLALHPAFPDDPRVYLSYSYTEGSRIMNRIVSMEERDGRGVNETVLVDRIPGASIHDGSRLAFGPDGLLYATTGDAANEMSAQDESSLSGKVLRITPDGEVPSGNPDPSSPVFTLGHRNPQGLAFHPETGRATISEHGPENHDEVNVLRAGANYGWPILRGDMGAAAFTPSVWTSGPLGTIAPAGAAFVEAEGSPLDGAFVFGTLKGRHLHVLHLGPDGTSVEGEARLFDGDHGRIRAVLWHDGALYLGTSNRDGRGSPGAQDDRVVRVPLAALEAAYEAAR